MADSRLATLRIAIVSNSRRYVECPFQAEPGTSEAGRVRSDAPRPRTLLVGPHRTFASREITRSRATPATPNCQLARER
jgi:hypothetical protein